MSLKKKKILLMSVSLLFASTVVGQTDNAFYRQAGDHAALYQGLIEPPFPFSLWATHPYWGDDKFRRGKVMFDGHLYENVDMRFNAYDQQLVVRTPVRNLSVAPDRNKVEWFELDGMHMVPFADVYAQVDYDGANVRALTLHRKLKMADVQWGQHFLKDMRPFDSYLLASADGHAVVVTRLRDVIRAFPAYKEQIKTYSRTMHLKWKREALPVSVVACAQFLDERGARLASASSVDGESPISSSTWQEGVVLPPFRYSVVDSLGEDYDEALLDKSLSVYNAYVNGAHVNPVDFEELVQEDRTGVNNLEVMREYLIDEVEVLASTPKSETLHLGMEKFRPSEFRNVPLAMGEADLMKLLQLMPGVTTIGEASSGINVRGGASDQNLILLGNNTIFNPMHMFGLFSAFSPDMVSETELYKGGIPSRYGGRLSAVMTNTNRVADKQKTTGSLSLGLISSKALLELPLVKDKASLLISGRTTYSDWMLKRIPAGTGYHNGNAAFWDLGATLDVTPDEQQRMTVSGYYSHDRFEFTKGLRYEYTNANASAQWRFHPAAVEGLSLTFSAGMDHYDYSNLTGQTTYKGNLTYYTTSELAFDINQAFAKAIANYQLNDAHNLESGLHAQYIDINPGSLTPLFAESALVATQLDPDRALQTTLFAEDRWTLTDKLNVSGGARLTLFNAFTQNKKHTYLSPEVRLASSYSLTDNYSLKASFNTMNQFIHKVSNTVIMSPTDTWMLSHKGIKPQTGWQAATGAFYLSSDSQYEISLECYYKQLYNYLTYRSAAQLIMNPNLDNELLPVGGRAYGIELQFRKHTGSLNGWISYCYSRTELRQKSKNHINPLVDPMAYQQDIYMLINEGRWFPADFDRPHQVKFVGNYKFTRRYSLSLNADYSTGRPITIPVGKFYDMAHDRMIPFYTDRNAYRLPYNFRLDGSFNIEPGHHLTKATHGWFTVGVYNITGRHNAYSVYYEASPQSIRGYQLSIFACPVPYVSYNLKF